MLEVMNVQTKANGSDCGLFAIVLATELVHGCDPTCQLDQPLMRNHFIECLMEGKYDDSQSKSIEGLGLGREFRNQCMKKSSACVNSQTTRKDR